MLEKGFSTVIRYGYSVMKKKFAKNIPYLLLPVFGVLLLAEALWLSSFFGAAPQKDAAFRGYQPVREQFFLERGDGTYTLAEAVYPKDHPGSMPLVAMGHGFTGTRNSGGAEELAERLAGCGIATVRMDFDPYTKPAKDSARTHDYTLSSMQADLLRGIGYMRGHYDIDTTRIGLYARSMGGRVAMTMANESSGGYDYQALALVAPAGNRTAMIDYMGGQAAWDKMKETAVRDGFVLRQGLKLTPEWFAEFEAYDPCRHGDRFGEKPVLVIRNTLDYVVTPTTSLECAKAYKNSRVITVTTDNYHGYEMSYADSALKEQLMSAITDHFVSAFAE